MYNSIRDSIYFRGEWKSGCKICNLIPNQIPGFLQTGCSQVHFRCNSTQTLYSCLTRTFKSSFEFLWTPNAVALQSQAHREKS